MANLEIVTTDEDIRGMILRWSAGGEAFLIQTDTKGVNQYIIIPKSEALQLIAGLTAFVEGKNEHASDCALHNSPAYPIEPCDCLQRK